MRLATVCLGSCSGCHINLLNTGDEITALISQTELVFSPLLADFKAPTSADLTLVEGAPRNEEDLDRLYRIREASKTLVTIGSCAVYGGITGLANVTSREDLVQTAFRSAPDATPALNKRVYPVDYYVDVDWQVPGCPPPVNVLRQFIAAVAAGREPPHYDLPVCAECSRRSQPHVHAEFLRTIQTPPEPDECLLSQGYICLGSVTRSGCEANCTSAGVPCMGCRGPVDRVFAEPGHGIFRDLVKRRAHFLGLSEAVVEGRLYDIAHTLYLFTLSSPAMRRKRSERVARAVHKLHLKPGETP